MRGKRSKQYRKLMQQYALTFGFREPYQVLVDAQMIQDTHRFSMDLLPALARTLHGEVKAMITQCSIRHLFALPTTSSDDAEKSSSLKQVVTKVEKTAFLEISRSLTLRRCNHHTLPEPLSTLDCYQDVLDSKDQGTNKHRYVLAAQAEDVRAWARGVKGVPMIYVKRSVMVMEPMAQASVGVREKEEKVKLRSGVKKVSGGGDVLGKRKRDASEDASAKENGDAEEQAPEKKRKKVRGQKGPNPLSMKKKKRKSQPSESNGAISNPERRQATHSSATQSIVEEAKKKRRRKHKSGGTIESAGNDEMASISVAPVETE